MEDKYFHSGVTIELPEHGLLCYQHFKGGETWGLRYYEGTNDLISSHKSKLRKEDHICKKISYSRVYYIKRKKKRKFHNGNGQYLSRMDQKRKHGQFNSK